jgi:hypothetical protein
VTYKDELENRKNARKLAQHEVKQDQPAKLASRKKDLLAHLEKNIRDLGVTIETDDQTGAIGGLFLWPGAVQECSGLVRPPPRSRPQPL